MAQLEFQAPAVAALKKHFRLRETVKWGELDIHPPVVVNGSVSSGKSYMICETALAVREAAIARDIRQSVFVLVIQRQGELCGQNSEAAWDIGLQNSIFSASYGKKSTHFQVVYATEGTIARALESYRFSPYTREELAMPAEQRARLGKFHPDLIMVDECHQFPFEKPDSQYPTLLRHFYVCKPHMRVAGFTGSPFRDIQPIVGNTPDHLWRKFASIEPDDPDYPEGGVGNGIISTEFMIQEGWVVPPIFGYPDSEDRQYDFSHITPDGWVYDEAELDAATSDRETCLAICADVIEKAASRKGVLVFASTQRHARMIAAAFKILGVADDKIGVIIDSTKNKDRRNILAKAKTGDIKYTINVGVLTTGVNVPWWDTLVYMRPIGSLVLLIQSIGRVLRLLILDGEVPMQQRSNRFGLDAADRLALIAASSKPDSLVLDYAGVMDTLGHLYENPILEQAELAKAKKDHLELIHCPACETENSPHARRCIGLDEVTKERCDHFWHFRQCPGCGTKNDQVARECRNKDCRRMLIDPNAALSGKHYHEGESTPVLAMKAGKGAGGKLWFRYELSDGRTPIEIFYPHAGKNRKINSAIWAKFVDQLPVEVRDKLRLKGMKAETVIDNIHLIPQPIEVSAREKNDKWSVGRRKYADQKILMGEAV